MDLGYSENELSELETINRQSEQKLKTYVKANLPKGKDAKQ
jgi:hypothetical protein